MSAVQFHCPLCDGLFQVDDSLAGIEVNCPHCQGLVTVPDFAAAPPMPPAVETLELNCPICAGPFQVTPDMSGQEVACPHCHQTVAVPDLGFHAPLPPSFAPPPPPPPSGPMLPPGIDAASMYPPGFAPSPSVPPPQIPVGKATTTDWPPARTGDAWPPQRENERPLQPSSRPIPATKPQRPSVDPMLPPGVSTPRPTPSSAPDPMLPPSTGAPARTPESSDLLPPGASGAASSERVPLPAAIPTRSKDTVLIPTERGLVGVHEPVKTIQHRGQEVELRKLTPEEKSRRRIVRNAILFTFCVIALIVVAALFMAK